MPTSINYNLQTISTTNFFTKRWLVFIIFFPHNNICVDRVKYIFYTFCYNI